MVKLKSYEGPIDFTANFTVNDNLLSDFINYATTHGVPMDQKGYNRSKPEIKNQLKSLFARIAWDDEGLYRTINENDATFNKAVELFK
jgi:carboxyl-terminal processing protease